MRAQVFTLVNFGIFEIGTPDEPFTEQAEVVVHGNRTSPTLVVTDQHYLGNKVIANFGNLSWVGVTPNVTSVRLASTATAGTSVLTLLDAVDWPIGHRIVVAATERLPTAWSSDTGSYSGNRWVGLPGPADFTSASEEHVVVRTLS